MELGAGVWEGGHVVGGLEGGREGVRVEGPGAGLVEAREAAGEASDL